MAADPFAFLQLWYKNQCDEDWEHQYGVQIQTLDNPGWSLIVDLFDTYLEGDRTNRRVVERSAENWLHWWSDGEQFHARCGATNLVEAVKKFEEFVISRPSSR